MHRTIRYDLSKIKGCTTGTGEQIVAFSIRSTDGTDEAFAAKQADARGTTMTEELIRYSLVSYEVASAEGDQKVVKVIDIDHKAPFTAFDEWSTKARNFVVAAWKKLSTPDEAEIKDFFEHATEIE